MPYAINDTHDASLTSWVESANEPDTDFPIQNLPLGVALGESEDGQTLSAIFCAIGDMALNLTGCYAEGLLHTSDDDDFFDDIDDMAFSLNDIAAAGPAFTSELRKRIQHLLLDSTPTLRDNAELRNALLVPIEDLDLIVPLSIGDYTDFYASVHHATNVGSMFRPDNPLLPNYKWIPVGYHGRASSVIPSGTIVTRPKGQTIAGEGEDPIYQPCKLLDYELEVGFYVGQPNDLGSPVPITSAEDHILGMSLVNDWSARDIQKWEYVPLGPFLSKSFATTVSPWVVTLDALAPFRAPALQRNADDPKPLPHLFDKANQEQGGVDITLEVHIHTEKMREQNLPPHKLSSGSFTNMYWTIAQMLTHHSSNGCNLNPGDLMASGTVSGPTKDQRGCMLELTWRGSEPIDLPTGETRKFLQDGDDVYITGYCQREGYRRIGFGSCMGRIEAARS